MQYEEMTIGEHVGDLVKVAKIIKRQIDEKQVNSEPFFLYLETLIERIEDLANKVKE